jgi:sulfate permease, SulP family
MAQLDSFKIADSSGVRTWLTGQNLGVMLVLVAVTMGIIYGLPKLTRAVPATLVGIVAVTLVAVFGLPVFGLTTSTVADLAGTIHGGLPPFDFPVAPMTWASLFTWHTVAIIGPYAVILAGVGLIESLMTLNLIDEMTGTRGNSNRECMGQGLANVTSGMFSGMGGCAMIGQSLINVNSGGRRRLSGITAAVCLLCFILFASPLIEQIPMAALVGVMFMVVIGTFEWASLRMWHRIPRSDFLIIVTVTLVTVFAHNLALAVVTGVIIAALVFAWQHATHLTVIATTDASGVKTYQLHGPLFFASVSRFQGLFDPSRDPDEVAIDFYFSRAYDQSALEAISNLAERYLKAGKRLHLRHLSPECRELLDRARDLVDIDQSTDPHYHVSVNGFPASSGRRRAALLPEAGARRDDQQTCP